MSVDISGFEDVSKERKSKVWINMLFHKQKGLALCKICLEKLHYALKSIQPSSVESERCFSTCGFYDTKIRSHMGDETLSALLFLNKQFKKSVHKGSRLEKLDQLDKPKDPKPNPAIEKVKKTQTIKKMFASASQSKQEQKDIKGRNDPNQTISADPAIMKRGRAEYSSQSNANKRKAESKFKSSKPKKRTIELSISSDSDANIDEKDIVQSDPEIDEDSDEETLMIK